MGPYRDDQLNHHTRPSSSHWGYLLALLAGILVVAFAAVLSSNKAQPTPTATPVVIRTTTANPSVTATRMPTITSTSTSTATVSFNTPKKSAHFETSTPAHGTTLAAVPINVVIDFNFDLAKPSNITVTHVAKNQIVSTSETTIDTNKLAMRRMINPTAPDGLYLVTYSACWPDTSCHDGQFQFAIDRTRATSYLDQRNQAAVTVQLANYAFGPQNIRITKGTKVTWVNDDTDTHYVNTDSHPAHTYYPLQNSKALAKGESFSTTFDTPGVYPYHCSAHTSMTANIIVE